MRARECLGKVNIFFVHKKVGIVRLKIRSWKSLLFEVTIL